MYTVINHLALNVPADSLKPDFERGVQVLRDLDGLVSANIVKEGDSQVAVVLVWQSQSHAEAGAAKFGPSWFAQNLAPRLAGPQQRTAGETIAQS
jgi:hypothetical protein